MWSVMGVCHNINSPGRNGPEGPFMSSYLVQPDHLCIDIIINGPTHGHFALYACN